MGSVKGDALVLSGEMAPPATRRRVRRVDRRRRGRRVRWPVVLTLAVLVVVGAGVLWPWADGQARAAVVLVSVLEVPVATPAVRAVTGEPRVAETRVAGNPTSVFVPAGNGPHPAILFVNGAVMEGRKLPEVRRLADGLARAGYLTVVPDLPGLTSDEITADTLDATVESALAVAGRPDALDGRVGLVGGSTGAALAILAAEDPRLSGRVRAVSGIAPYADIRTVLNVGTTGHYWRDGKLHRYPVEPFLSYVVARSLVYALPPGGDRDTLLEQMSPIPRYSPDPLRVFRERTPDDLGPEARSVVALLANTDPRRFDQLYRGLPAETRRDMERLSPVAGAGRLEAPVEIVSGNRDPYFPISESYALQRVAPNKTVTVTAVLDHYRPNVSLRDAPEFLKLNGFAVRSLQNMRAETGSGR